MNDILDTLSDDDDDFELELLESLGGLDVTDDEDGVYSELRAREVTDAIRSAAVATYVLLAEAHAHKAHLALGYDTWAEYVESEFDMSAQRSYQLLDLSRVIQEIEAATDTEGVKLTEAQARDIKRELPMVTERIREAIDGGESSEEAVARIVDEVRAQKKADDDAVAAKEKALGEAQQEGYQQGLEAAADALLEADRPEGISDSADNEFIEVEVQGEGGTLSPEDSMNLYNFFNVLSGVTSLPEPEDFIKIIPKSRAGEIENQVFQAASWINMFLTLWEVREDDE